MGNNAAKVVRFESVADAKQSTGEPQVFRFGVFELDLHARELRRNGSRVKLQEQPFHVLVLLLEKPGAVVSREELQSRLWPADTFVDFDHSLNAAIRDCVMPSAMQQKILDLWRPWRAAATDFWHRS